MHPVGGKRLARVRFRLNELVFMVGKDQVEAAAVNIEMAAQILHAHRRAFDVPAGRPGPHGLGHDGSPGLERFQRAKSPG